MSSLPDQVAQYVQAQRQAGYSDQQIKQALLNTGYTQAQVDAAFSAQASPSSPNNDAAMQLVEGLARQGYSSVQAFGQITQQGFDQKLARAAVKAVYGAHALPEAHHPGRIAFALITVLVAVAGVFFITGFQRGDFGTTPPDDPPIIGDHGGVSVPEQLDIVMRIARDQGKTPALAECETRFRGDDRDLCYLDVTLALIDKAPDDTICDKIVDYKMRDVCLMNFLETDRFTAVCDRMQLADNKQTCDQLRAIKGV